MDKISVRLRIVSGFFAIILILGSIYVMSALRLVSLDRNASGIVEKTEVVRWIDDYAEAVTAQAASLRAFAFSGLEYDKELVEVSRRAAASSRERVTAVLELAGEKAIVAEISAKGSTFDDVFNSIENRLGNSEDALQVVVVGLGKLERSGSTLHEFLTSRSEPEAQQLASPLPEIIGRVSQFGVAYVAGGQSVDFEEAIKAAEELDLLVRSATQLARQLRISRRQSSVIRFVQRDGDVVRQSLRQAFATNSGLQAALSQLGTAAQEINQITARVERDARERQSMALEEMVSAVSKAINASIYGFLIGAAAAVGLAVLIGGSIATPLVRITGALSSLAAGKKNTDVPYQRRHDELGSLAQAAQIFKEKALELEKVAAEKAKAEMEASEMERRRIIERTALEEKHRAEEAEARQARAEVRRIQRLKMADKFEERVLKVVEAVNRASNQVAQASRGVVANSAQTKTQVQSSFDATDETSQNVQSVAGATEELAVSFGSVGYELGESAKIAETAVGQAAETTQTVKGLASAAAQIGQVTSLIKDIADQTNLLALNATIEAARAGDAGRGFAVVAQEVKNLAAQSSNSAEEISRYVNTIQRVSSDAGTAIGDISGTIGQMNDVTQSVVTAVEQQSAATQEIASNVQFVSQSTEHIMESINIVGGAADEMEVMSSELQQSAETLTLEASALDGEVRSFLEEIRGEDETGTDLQRQAGQRSAEVHLLRSA